MSTPSRPVPRLGRRAALVAALLAALGAAVLAGSPADAATAAAPVTTQIGTSVRGIPLYVTRYPNPSATRRVFVIGVIHGDERAGRYVVYRLARAAKPANVELHLMYTMNPDGEAAYRRQNAHGVDLNRNYPRGWAATAPGSTYYGGPSPLSEPESRAVARYLLLWRPTFTMVIHQPLYGIGTPPKNVSFAQRLARETGLPLKSFNCNGVCRGTMSDWANATLPGVAVTVELGASVSTAQLDRVSAGMLRAVAAQPG